MPPRIKHTRTGPSHREVLDSFAKDLEPGPLLSALMQTLPDAHLFLKDKEGRFVAASESFARLIGAGCAADLLGKRDHDFIPDFIAKAFVKDDLSIFKSGVPIVDKVELVPARNSLDWLTTSKIPLYGRDGGIIGLVGAIRKTEDSDEIYRDHPVVHRIVDFLSENYPQKIGVSDMASLAGISASTVERLFRRTFRISPLKYLKKVRLHCACKMLRNSHKTLTVIARECGFNDPTGMSRDFRTELKISPRSYRKSFGRNTRPVKKNHSKN
jgi:AraC-like DNA-binding protein